MYGTVYYTQATKDTVPASAAVTGTIETVGRKVIGTNTLFTTEYQVNDWLYVAAQSAVRKVVSINSNTEMTLDVAFGSDVAAGGTPKRVPYQTCRFMKIHNSGGGTATIDGQNLITTTIAEFSKVGAFGSSTALKDFIDPIVLDGTSSTCQVTIVK